MKTENEKGPGHVDRLNTLAKLHAEGFDGPDASLAESLFCYGIAWRKLENGAWLFVYSIPGRSDRFDRSEIKERDPRLEWNWAFDGKHEYGFLDFLGSTLEDWLARPFPEQVMDLVSYYGTEEIFGSCYWEGFAIQDED